MIDLCADANPIIQRGTFQYIELGENGAQQAGGSRLTAQALLRNALREASDLARRGADPLRSRGRAAPVDTGDDVPVDQSGVVIWDGDPLEGISGVVAVWIDGVAQPLVNQQTRLRDRYKTSTEGSLPKAYDW